MLVGLRRGFGAPLGPPYVAFAAVAVALGVTRFRGRSARHSPGSEGFQPTEVTSGTEGLTGLRCGGDRGGRMTQSLVATVFSWLGIFGAMLTMLGNLQTALSLSEWAKWMAAHWQAWMMAFWGSYLGLSKYLTSAAFILVDIPFAVCLTVIATASFYSSGTDQKPPAHRPIYSLIGGAALLAGYYFVTDDVYGFVPLTFHLAFSMNWLVAFVMLSHWPYRLALTSASAVSILLFILLIAASNDTTPVTHLDLASRSIQGEGCAT